MVINSKRNQLLIPRFRVRVRRELTFLLPARLHIPAQYGVSNPVRGKGKNSSARQADKSGWRFFKRFDFR